MSTATPPAAAAAAADASKAILKQALQQRLAALERTLGKSSNATTIAAVPSTAVARPSPPAAAVAPAAPTAPLSALDAAKAMLAAKIAAKEARLAGNAAAVSPSPSPTPTSAAAASSAAAATAAPVTVVPAFKPASAGLSAHAKPFRPASAAAASAAASSTAATAAPAPASSAAAPVVVSVHKPHLCRSWLTCTFGSKCRFRHPTISTEPFFEYGGEVLLHLNALASATAAQSAMPEPSSYAAPSAMPPVLLLILTLILQAGAAETGGAASLPLLQLWSSLKDQLQGCKDLPANQDDMLNTMGLPTTAAVLTRAAEGQVVLSTEAFRNMYASVFSICRQAGTFLVTHQWDEERRQQLQHAIDAQRKPQEQQRKGTKRAAPASTTSQAFTMASAAAADPDDENRKRKRVTDAELEARGALSTHSRRLGEAYPEEQSAATLSMRPVAAAAAAPASRPLSHSTSSGHYSMDAGEELGGATAFVRGGIVTELSLLSASAAAQQRSRQQQQALDDDEDPFTRAIRRQNQVSTHATYTLRTKKIDSGKGFDMLQKMNWRNGQGLGKRKQGRVEPVEVKFRADRTGL